MKNLFVTLFAISALTAIAGCTRHMDPSMPPKTTVDTTAVNSKEGQNENPRVDAGHMDNNGTNVESANKIFPKGQEGAAPGGTTAPANHEVSEPR